MNACLLSLSSSLWSGSSTQSSQSQYSWPYHPPFLSGTSLLLWCPASCLRLIKESWRVRPQSAGKRTRARGITARTHSSRTYWNGGSRPRPTPNRPAYTRREQLGTIGLTLSSRSVVCRLLTRRLRNFRQVRLLIRQSYLCTWNRRSAS